ncbi:patatin-like phospholipase family protein [Salinarimonas rosea]|uniref:patatin-like phospholipase family protein n=1 Tax=Salinarimonas rosea TaxID=552063 RepID=UPI00040B24EC|nr:patatin-like phospholipase family protein [Salinarimonas rosea]
MSRRSDLRPTRAQAARRRAAFTPREREGRLVPRNGGPTVGLALGSGGARGLAHIVVLEALDEIGIRPAAIVGCSMGAVVGAAYCAGIPARALRQHVLDAMEDRARVMARLVEARVGRLVDVFNGLGNPLLLDGEKILDAFWPGGVPARIEELEIPFEAVACDFFARSEVTYARGRLVPAVAGSMAIPGLFKPVAFEGRTLIDGGAVNPLPFDNLIGKADVVVAVDVAAGPALDPSRLVSGIDVSFGAVEIMQEAIVQAKLKLACPQIMLRPPVQAFRVLEFFEAKALFEAVEPIKDALKREIERQLGLVGRSESAPATLGPPPTGGPQPSG